MATTINVTFNGLVELRGRVERRQLQDDDWVVVGALVSKLITRTEARQERLRVKANQQTAQEHETPDTTCPGFDSRSHNEPTEESPASQRSPLHPKEDTQGTDASDNADAAGEDEQRRKGHGRMGSKAFTNATHVRHALDDGVIGSKCEACGIGPVCAYRDKIIIRVIGQPNFAAQRHCFGQGRCKLCGAILTAKGTQAVLQGIGTSYITYDWSACAMLIVMHYFAGDPFKRIESLQQGWGVPMPDANQWRMVNESDDRLAPLYKALEAHAIRHALNISIDDTGAMIIEVKRAIRKELEALAAVGE
jgi:hypothetical protein